jgi:HSP20 family molecular chaperone IbpA
MKSQLAAVMERTKEPELLKHGSEEISNRFSQIYDVIARRAFDIFESCGRVPGHELEDWFRAESELLRPVPLNVTESNDEYIVRAEVPGFGSKDIEVIVKRSVWRFQASAKRTKTSRMEKCSAPSRAPTESFGSSIFRQLSTPPRSAQP